MRLTTRSIGFLLMLLGAWGAVVSYVGPKFDFPFPAGSDVSAWHWSDVAWQLSLLPGIAAVIGGAILLGSLGVVRGAPAIGALVALAAGTWFVVGEEFSRLWGSPPADGTGSDWMVIATNLGYHEGLGVAIVALSACAIGLLALLPAARTKTEPTIDHPVLDREPERRYEREPVER